MTSPYPGKDGERLKSGVLVRFAADETLVTSVTGSKTLSIPEDLVQRCGLLADIRDNDDSGYHEVAIQLSMRQVECWLKCTTLGDAGELLRHDADTLAGALKVIRPNGEHQYLFESKCWHFSLSV